MLSRLPGGLDRVVIPLVLAVLFIGLALVVHRVVFRILRSIAEASQSRSDDVVVRRLARPSRWALVAIAVIWAARASPEIETAWEPIAGFVMPALVGWIAFSILQALIEAMALRADITVPDNRNARRKRTRLAIFGRIAGFVIIFITVGMMLFSIPGVRAVGVTLMASAGLAGLAVGAAAQPALKSLIAGFQMALTEPISIDDVVIVDGEWGRIEDIRTTYVIVRTWDERRLVVPTSKFLEETFQNWTREGAELLAPVILHLDPLTRVAPLREEFLRQLEEHPLWDRRVGGMQVVETLPDTIQLRLLMSAANSGDAWDLRCDLRESLLAWIRENQPEAIVRRRIETAGGSAVLVRVEHEASGPSDGEAPAP